MAAYFDERYKFHSRIYYQTYYQFCEKWPRKRIVYGGCDNYLHKSRPFILAGYYMENNLRKLNKFLIR